MAQAVAHGLQAPHGGVDLVGLGAELGAVDVGLTIGCEHGGDLVQGEAGYAAERDQGQLVQHSRVEHAAQAMATCGGDQALFLIEPQGGCRDA